MRRSPTPRPATQVVDQDTQKAMMAWYHKKQEEQKVRGRARVACREGSRRSGWTGGGEDEVPRSPAGAWAKDLGELFNHFVTWVELPSAPSAMFRDCLVPGSSFV